MDYIAVVCYKDINGDIIVEDYNITDILGIMTATPGPAQNLGAGSAPKIDGFANNTAPIYGLPVMDAFVVVWNQPTLYDIGIYAGEVGDVTNSFYQNSYTDAGINPDVAAVRDIGSNELYACVVCAYNSLGWDNHVYDFNVSAMPPSVPVITNLGGITYPRMRVEGMALYLKPAPKWSVISFNDFNALRYYTSLNPTSINYPTPIERNYAAAIAAGPGPFVSYSSGATIGNRQVTLAWAGINSSGVPKVVSTAFDKGGLAPKYFLPPNYPFMTYQYATVNMDPINNVFIDTNQYEVAIAACCNSGKGLIAAWWNGLNDIRYKITPGNDYAFKPAGLQEASQPALSFSVFPNPAATDLNIKYSGFTIQKVKITDVSGKQVLEMPFKDAPVDISALPAGDYFISLTTGNNSVMTRPLVIAR